MSEGEPKNSHNYPKSNPNRIFEPTGPFLPKNNDVQMSSDFVYRGVHKSAASDMFTSGVVRNSAAAGVGNVRKYNEAVYWTRGQDGEHHNIQPEYVVLEAPHTVALERAVKSTDVVGVYAKNEEGGVENKLEHFRTEHKKLDDVRKRLGLSETREVDE